MLYMAMHFSKYNLVQSNILVRRCNDANSTCITLTYNHQY